jgi:hypothetical protein
MDGLDLLFDRLSSLVAIGGQIIICVPNGRKADFQEQSGSLLEMPPNHIGRWSRSALEIVAGRYDFEIRALDKEPFTLSNFIKQDIAYSYLRKAQQSGTLANWSRTKRSTRGGKVIGAACALALAPLRFPVWFQASRRRKEIGGSLWVEFKRNR